MTDMSPLVGCAALAVLELDAALVAQTLVSRPFVVGILLGALSGAPHSGALFGASLELMSLVDLPVGGCLAWSAPVAAGTAALLAGRGCAIPVSLAGGIAAGVVHSHLEAFERARRAATGDVLAGHAASGGWTLGLALGVSLTIHVAITFAVSFAAVTLITTFDRYWWPLAPEFVRAGAAFAAANAAWIGLSSVVAWGLRRR